MIYTRNECLMSSVCVSAIANHWFLDKGNVRKSERKWCNKVLTKIDVIWISQKCYW